MKGFNFMRSKSFALDLGNSNTLVSDEESILVDQPSYIVYDDVHRAVKAIGAEAYQMFEKTHDDMRAVRPMRAGVIADYESAAAMIGQMISKSAIRPSFYEGFDHVISGVPYTTTEVERRALLSVLEQFNARKTHLVYEPLVAALGMGLNIQEPNGKMVVDVGGGITEIVIISLSGVAAFEALKTSGDTMDSDIRDHFRRKYNMGIGLKTAEQVKIRVGAVTTHSEVENQVMMVKGKDMVTGIPITRKIDSEEVSIILERSIAAIETAIVKTLEKCPPELSSDIYQNGIHLTGGNAMLRGLRQRMETKIKVPIWIDDHALKSVTLGIAQVLREPVKYRSMLIR
jgi:rod shape-determining protein MreB